MPASIFTSMLFSCWINQVILPAKFSIFWIWLTSFSQWWWTCVSDLLISYKLSKGQFQNLMKETVSLPRKWQMCICTYIHTHMQEILHMISKASQIPLTPQTPGGFALIETCLDSVETATPYSIISRSLWCPRVPLVVWLRLVLSALSFIKFSISLLPKDLGS